MVGTEAQQRRSPRQIPSTEDRHAPEEAVQNPSYPRRKFGDAHAERFVNRRAGFAATFFLSAMLPDASTRIAAPPRRSGAGNPIHAVSSCKS